MVCARQRHSDTQHLPHDHELLLRYCTTTILWLEHTRVRTMRAPYVRLKKNATERLFIIIGSGPAKSTKKKKSNKFLNGKNQTRQQKRRKKNESTARRHHTATHTLLIASHNKSCVAFAANLRSSRRSHRVPAPSPVLFRSSVEAVHDDIAPARAAATAAMVAMAPTEGTELTPPPSVSVDPPSSAVVGAAVGAPVGPSLVPGSI